MSPRLTIDLDKIERNTRVITSLCRAHGITVSGVTKGVCGHPEVAQAMRRGGVESISDSRLENLRRLRAGGVKGSLELIRLPALSEVGEVVEWADLSLNSELPVVRALSRAASGAGRVHGVVLMVELGDLREGMKPEDLQPVAKEVLGLPGLRLAGIGANLGCFAGVVPNRENTARLVELADRVGNSLGVELERISAFNSSGLELIASGMAPAGPNHARLGESLLLGRETTCRKAWPGTCQDAFLLTAEVLELQSKPSQPVGECAEDAFGRRPVFADRGELRRALLNVGREDVDVDGIVPRDPRLAVLGASSGYLVVDVSAAESAIQVGSEVSFEPSYGALLRAMTSEYVKKRFFRKGVSCSGGDP